MPEPRLSVLIVAKNEAHNLADCLRAASWADERVVVVDRASRDATREIAESMADVVIVRPFDDFASQRNCALEAATGDWVLSIDADERATPALADEVRRVISDPANPWSGFRVPIRSVILGRPFAFSGTQHDLPLRLFRRACGRWAGLVHETVELEGRCGTIRSALGHHTLPSVEVFLEKLDHYTTLEARSLLDVRRRFRTSDVTLRPVWTFLKLYVFKQGFRDGVEGFMFCSFRGFRGGEGVETSGADRPGEGLMIAEHEAVVAGRFDSLCARFKPAVAPDDPRLLAIVERLSPLEGRRILDLGCGKGRFARSLVERGAQVVGLDISAGMLAQAAGLSRVRGSARRLPFGRASFDGVMAVEVFEHLAPEALDRVCGEVLRVLEPGGTLVVIDKNACSWNARRPWLPSAAVKWIDERRGLWMTAAAIGVRERWFRPRELKRRLGRWFPEVRVWHLLSRSEMGRFPFQWMPAARLLVLWAAKAPGGPL